MRLILKLMLAHFRRHWFRTLIALAAIVTSVAMVIFQAALQDAALARMGLNAAKAAGALGRYDMVVYSASTKEVQANRTRSGVVGPMGAMDDSLLQWLRASRDVQSMVECCQMSVEACPPGRVFRTDMYHPGEQVNCPLFATASAESPAELIRGAWISDSPEPRMVVDATLVARLMAPAVDPSSRPAGPPSGMGMGMMGGEPPSPPDNAVGSTFQLITDTGKHDVKVGGIVKGPTAQRSLSGFYVSIPAFEKLTGQKYKVNRILIDLKEGVSEEKFGERLTAEARRLEQPLHIETGADFQAQASMFGAMGGRGGGFFPLFRDVAVNLAILAAMFIIFTTLSMGLRERSRQLAMLRAIGMTRAKVLAMIVVETMALATVGFAVGTVAGLAFTYRQIDTGLNLHPGLWVLLGALAAYGATFAAAVLPALLAAFRRPLDSMQGSPYLHSRGLPVRLALLGLVLAAVLPLMVIFGDEQTIKALPLGILAAIVGLAMLTPVVFLFEGVLSRLVAPLLGLNHRLLSKHLRSNLWRTVGCTTALMVGLGLYVTVLVWGQSMLRSFLLTGQNPDAVITLLPEGVPPADVGALDELRGVKSVLPMILEHPELADLPENVQVGGIFSRDVICIGTDVKAMIDPEEGMIASSFVRGSAADAYAQLAQGNACLITDSLYIRFPDQYDVGKTVALQTTEGVRKTIRYTIAGVLRIDGWHLLTKSTQMRRGLGRVGGMVIVPDQTGRRDFPESTYKTFWFKMEEGADANRLELPIIRIVDPEARPIFPTSRPASGPASRPGMGGPGGPGMGGPGGPGMGGPGGRGMGPGRGFGPGGGRGGRGGGMLIDSPYYCRVTDTAAMTRSIQARAEGIINDNLQYPLMVLALASLAVVGTMMASVRVRSWEFGVLRSVGLTRGQLLRMVLAEGLLISLLACVLSGLFGVLCTWVALELGCRSWGVGATLTIPWGYLAIGFGLTVVLCLVGSLWPAIAKATAQPLRLLQEGRSSE